MSISGQQLTVLVIASSLCAAGTAQELDRPAKSDTDPSRPASKIAADPDVATRLSELEQNCDRLLRLRDSIIPERLPHISTVESAANQIVALNRANVALSKQHSSLSRQARDLQRSRDKSKDANERTNLQLQLQAVNGSAGDLSQQHANNLAEMTRLAAARDASARELERLNSELLRCWNELETVRSTRVDLFGTIDRHLRGDDAAIRSQFERWLMKDTYWLDGHFWAGLSAFELGDIEAAAELVERGKRIASETAVSLGRRASPGRLHALSGLLATRLTKQKIRGAEDLKAAVRVANQAKKDADWMVFVLAGRVAMDRDQNFAQAGTYLERASELKDSAIIQLWRARLQTMAPADAAERDMASGLKSLRAMWTADSMQSWRIGVFLIEAQAANGEREDAARTWARVRPRVPPDQLQTVSTTIEQMIAADPAK